MAVRTVNAQGYDAVMAVKQAAAAYPAEKVANGSSKSFEEILGKAGDKIADSSKAAVNDAKAPKSTEKPEVPASKSESGQKPDEKLEKAEIANDAEAETAVTDEKIVEDAKVEKREADDTKVEKTSDESEIDETQKESVDKLSMEQITDALMQIVDQIKELLGISDEEVLLGMEKADLNMTDLLELAGISKLLTVTAGEGDVMSLVTNAELYDALKELTKTVETVSNQLLDEMGITKDELDAMLAKLSNPENAEALKYANPQEQTQTETSEKTSEAPETDAKQASAAQADAKPLIQADAYEKATPETETKQASKTEAVVEADAKQTVKTETDAKATPEAEAVETVTKPVNEEQEASIGEKTVAAADEDAEIPAEAKQPERTVPADDTGNRAAKNQIGSNVPNQQSNNAADTQIQPKAQKQNQHERGDTHGQKNSSNNFNGQPNAQGFDNRLNAVHTATEALARYTSENTQNILRQLADIVRVVRNENLTQMEMQLHPASLGTVNVSLVTKGGAVTAEFTAQNEAVKAAIEAQASQLIKNLEAQGVKVEAVEVSVAGHQLEKNLDENSRNEQSRQEQEEAQRIQGSRRNSINLNMYEDDEEILEEMQGADDATRIAMELMAANGNSMDLMA